MPDSTFRSDDGAQEAEQMQESAKDQPPPESAEPPEYDLDGAKVSADDLRAWKDAHSHREDWQRAYTQRDQSLAAQRRQLQQEQVRLRGLLDQIEAKVASRPPTDEGLPDDPELRSVVDPVLRRMERLEGLLTPLVSQSRSAQQREAAQARDAAYKQYQGHLVEVAKRAGVDQYRLFYEHFNQPDLSLESLAAGIRDTDRQAQLSAQPPPPAEQTRVSAGGKAAAAISAKDEEPLPFGDPRLTKRAENYLAGLAKARQG